MCVLFFFLYQGCEYGTPNLQIQLLFFSCPVLALFSHLFFCQTLDSISVYICLISLVSRFFCPTFDSNSMQNCFQHLSHLLFCLVFQLHPPRIASVLSDLTPAPSRIASTPQSSFILFDSFFSYIHPELLPTLWSFISLTLPPATTLS